MSQDITERFVPLSLSGRLPEAAGNRRRREMIVAAAQAVGQNPAYRFARLKHVLLPLWEKVSAQRTDEGFAAGQIRRLHPNL